MPDLEVSDDKLITELTRRGFVRSVANTIVTEKKLPEVEVTDDMIVSELEKKGITGEDAKKIVSGMDAESLEEIKNVYGLVIEVGTYPVSSIKTAEAIKVVENSQRDINIANH